VYLWSCGVLELSCICVDVCMCGVVYVWCCVCVALVIGGVVYVWMCGDIELWSCGCVKWGGLWSYGVV